MNMVDLDIDFNYLDIGFQVVQISQELLGIRLNWLGEDPTPISRNPDEVIFGTIYSVG